MNDTLVWLLILILLVGVEIATMGLTTIWFAGGALVATIIAAIGAPVYIQIVLFFVVSIVLLVFTRPIALRYFNKERIKTNAESLVGRLAMVTEEINNLKSTGQVAINGQEWMARANLEELILAPGSVVTIVAISGVKLIVEEKKGEN